MKSALRGKSISTAEVSNVSPDGFCLLVDDRELFVPFRDFPWFRDATIRQISSVERPSPQHLRWPDLDIDLTLESIKYPKRFPLVSCVRPKRSSPRPTGRPARKAH